MESGSMQRSCPGHQQTNKFTLFLPKRAQCSRTVYAGGLWGCGDTCGASYLAQGPGPLG